MKICECLKKKEVLIPIIIGITFFILNLIRFQSWFSTYITVYGGYGGEATINLIIGNVLASVFVGVMSYISFIFIDNQLRMHEVLERKKK
jgi:Mg/Co/Ni transporter MgtE